MVLSDWQKGKLPYYTNPPGYVEGGGGEGETGADVDGVSAMQGQVEAAEEAAAAEPEGAVTVRSRSRSRCHHCSVQKGFNVYMNVLCAYIVRAVCIYTVPGIRML